MTGRQALTRYLVVGFVLIVGLGVAAATQLPDGPSQYTVGASTVDVAMHGECCVVLSYGGLRLYLGPNPAPDYERDHGQELDRFYPLAWCLKEPGEEAPIPDLDGMPTCLGDQGDDVAEAARNLVRTYDFRREQQERARVAERARDAFNPKTVTEQIRKDLEDGESAGPQ